MTKSFFIFLLHLCILFPSTGQNTSYDSTFSNHQFKHFIVPLTLIGGGIALNNSDFKAKQTEFHDKNFSGYRTKVDDFIQYAPHAAVFGLDWVGVKSKHNFTDKVGLMVVGGILTVGTVTLLKSTTNQVRPDGSADNSFPSGHTANAFFGATILAKEYADKSIWYAIGGYSVATATGVLRILNNRHWTSDVLVGAGIGIISGELAYSIYPWLKDKLGIRNKKNIAFVPVYDGISMRANVVIGFN